MPRKIQTPEVEYSEEEKRIIAWSIAWEGTITIVMQRPTTFKQLNPHVCIGNTSPDLLKEFKKIVKLGKISSWRQRKPNHKLLGEWSIRNYVECLFILKEVVDYLPIKRESAEIVMRFCERRLQNWCKPYTDRDYQDYWKVRSLLQKGCKNGSSTKS